MTRFQLSARFRAWSYACALALASVSGASAQTGLRADYQFQNTRASSVTGASALIDLGTNQFVTEVVDGVSRTVLRFRAGDGLQLAPTAGLIQSNVFSMVLLCRFDRTEGYQRILDFKNGGTDTGFYTFGDELYFFDVEALSTNGNLQAGQYAQIVLTRGEDGVVAAYLNGEPSFTFDDPDSEAVIDGNTLRIFRDDDPASGESGAGAVARIRIFNRVLSPEEVAALGRASDDLRPRLSIRRSNTNTILSWPAEDARFVLQRVNSLSPTSIWESLPSPVTPEGGLFSVTNQSTLESGFYRLRRP